MRVRVMRRLMSRAAAERRHEARLARADRIARRVDAMYAEAWRDIARAIRRGGGWVVIHAAARAALRRLETLPHDVAGELVRAAHDSLRMVTGGLRVEKHDRIEDLSFELDAAGIGDVLPLPTLDDVLQTVYSSGWMTRLARITRLATPDALAAMIANIASTGKTPQEVMREVMPLVNRDRVVARRVARDATRHVAHEMEVRAWESLGTDIVVGYQIHAVRDARTRPEHARRDGTRYWRNPKPGQLGFDRMPRPPFESPADGSVLAYNCRCFLSPIIDA